MARSADLLWSSASVIVVRQTDNTVHFSALFTSNGSVTFQLRFLLLTNTRVVLSVVRFHCFRLVQTHARRTRTVSQSHPQRAPPGGAHVPARCFWHLLGTCAQVQSQQSGPYNLRPVLQARDRCYVQLSPLDHDSRALWRIQGRGSHQPSPDWEGTLRKTGGSNSNDKSSKGTAQNIQGPWIRWRQRPLRGAERGQDGVGDHG